MLISQRRPISVAHGTRPGIGRSAGARASRRSRWRGQPDGAAGPFSLPGALSFVNPDFAWPARIALMAIAAAGDGPARASFRGITVRSVGGHENKAVDRRKGRSIIGVLIAWIRRPAWRDGGFMAAEGAGWDSTTPSDRIFSRPGPSCVQPAPPANGRKKRSAYVPISIPGAALPRLGEPQQRLGRDRRARPCAGGRPGSVVVFLSILIYRCRILS